MQCTNELIHRKDMISVKDLSFSYGSKRVLNNITMELKGGNI